MRYRVEWDTDSDGDILHIDDCGLPDVVDVPDEIPVDEVADWLSDTYGWCVISAKEIV